MRKKLIIFILALIVFGGHGCSDSSATSPVTPTADPSGKVEGAGGCAPEYRAMADHAVVELKGEGELDIVVVTDPLCWHCRLGHKLLGESSEKYRSLKLLFFPRLSFIGSDMVAWILEDAAGTDRLKAMVDFGYSDLKRPKTNDLNEARAIMLAQFTSAFPDMLEGTNLSDLYDRLKADHEAHVIRGAELARAAELPGTPVLIAGKTVVVGYGPGKWLETLDENKICQ